MMSGETQRRVFEFVRDRILSGSVPTVREVQRAMGFRAVQSAQEHLDALVAEGLLEKIPRISRGYRLPEHQASAFMIPLLGRVQAGGLEDAVEDPEGYVAVDGNPSRSRLFALRVRGESMKNAAILPDDIVIVRQQSSAEHGDIVVALIDDQATVKRLKVTRDSGGSIRAELHPENPDFSPIIPVGDLHILGKVIEVRRQYEASVFYDSDVS